MEQNNIKAGKGLGLAGLLISSFALVGWAIVYFIFLFLGGYIPYKEQKTGTVVIPFMLIVSIMGLVVSIVGMIKAKKIGNKRLAIAGLVIGSIAFLLLIFSQL